MQQTADRAEAVGRLLHRAGVMLVTAESCTGGWIAKAVTDIAGSSAWFDRGFVTYSNLAKQEMLGVGESTLSAHGAVSEPVVAEMARGALQRSQAGVSVAVSGIAGPGGGAAGKPVGTVCLAWASAELVRTETCHFEGDRENIRLQAVRKALDGIQEILYIKTA